MSDADILENAKPEAVLTETTRVFVSGLPPTFTNVQLAAHFGSQFKVTDAHVIADRRIGFVGFVDSATAQNAAKHFNKTYVRMSRIAVDLARPVELANGKGGNSAPVSQKRQRGLEDKSKKRKRSQEDDGENLRSKADADADEKPSDDQETVDAATEDKADTDWLRGRTNRTLDLLDPDEVQIRQDEDDVPVEQNAKSAQTQVAADTEDDEETIAIPNARLFLRNLAFSVDELALRRHFEQFGKVQEVSHFSFLHVSTIPS